MMKFFKHRRLATWQELEEAGIAQKIEDFFFGMIALILMGMTGLLFYILLLVMFV